MRTSSWDTARDAVCQAARRMAQRGLVVARSGNVSQRLRDAQGRDLLAVTSTGKSYETLSPQDVVIIDFHGEPVEGEGIPSTETLTHLAIYRARPDVQAVLHTHSVYASALAVAGLELPPVLDELVVSLGGAVLVADYGFPSSEELAASAVSALGDRNAVLLRNHGLVGVGASLDQALAVCEMVERAAHIYVLACLLGQAHPLPAEVVETETALYRMRRQAENL